MHGTDGTLGTLALAHLQETTSSGHSAKPALRAEKRRERRIATDEPARMHALEIPTELRATVSVSSETPGELVKRLSAEGAKHLYIDGGVTIQRFIDAGLLDEFTITRIPVLLGSGIRLFGPLKQDVTLTLLATKSEFGYVQVKYRVEHD